MSAGTKQAPIASEAASRAVAKVTPEGEEYRDDPDVRERLPAQIVRDLCRLNPVKATAALLHTSAVITLALTVALVWWSPLVVIGAVIVIASRQQALFILAHDAAHYRLFANRRLNDVVGRTCGTLVGISMCTYRVVHRLHHNHLYTARDPDTPLHGGYPRGRGYLLKKLGRDLLGLTAWKTYSYFFGAPMANGDVGTQTRPLTDTSAKLRREAREDRWVVLGFHAAVLVAAVAAGVGVEYAVLWLLPALTVLQALLRLRGICEHGAVTDLTSARTASRTNLGNPWLVWFLFPHHVNYHVEHHCYPAVPHYNLPACHRALNAHGLLAGAEVRAIGETVRRVFGVPNRGQTEG